MADSPDVTLVYLTKARRAIESEKRRGTFSSYSLISKNEEYRQAYQEYLEADSILQTSSSENPAIYFESIAHILDFERMRSNSESWINWNRKALNHAQHLHDTARQIAFHLNFADKYTNNLTFKNAAGHFASAKCLLESWKDKDVFYEVRWFQRYAAFLNAQEKEAQSIPYSHHALKLVLENEMIGAGISYNELGYAFERMAVLDSALFYQQKAIEAWEKSHDGNLALVYLNTSNTLRKLKRFDEYLRFLQIALQRSMERRVFWIAETAARKIAEEYNRREVFEKAFLFARMRSSLLYFGKKLGGIEKEFLAEAEYEVSSHLQKLQEKEVILEKAEQEKRETRKYLLAAGALSILMLIVVAIIFYYNQKLKKRGHQLQKQKDQIDIQNKKLGASALQNEMLLKEVHHRVKNNLTILSGLFYLQEKEVGEEDRAFLQECRNRIHSMALVHQKLYQADDMSNIEFESYIKELLQTLASSNAPKDIKINYVVDCKGVRLDVDHAIPLALIITELVTNSFKYAFHEVEEGEIGVILSSKDHQIDLEVYDNGPGLKEEYDEKKVKSLGMRLIRILARQIYAETRYNKGKNSSFHFIFAAN